MRVSIVIPMRNEEACVDRCLYSILGFLQDRDDIEILSIDRVSMDRTR
jgi:glycosyltransferase involved in cell wall biosynthesis